MTAKNYATWSLSLDTECPACRKDFDVLAMDDFWEDHRIEVCERSTPATRDVEVECPHCSHQFAVDFKY